jgi:adenylate cyclase
MSRKGVFIIWLVLVIITINVYLFYSAPKEINDAQLESVEYKYSSQDLFTILAGINDKTRTLYTKSIVGSGKKAGLRFDEDWDSQNVEAGPLPALFLRETSLLIEKSPVELGLYLGSDFPISKANKFQGLQSRKFQELKRDESPQFFFDKSSERNVAMFPDYASANACVKCHNNHNQSPKIDWELMDVMGATTWSVRADSLTTDQLMEYVKVYKTSALEVYTRYLNKVMGFKESEIPSIGNRWPSDGYFLPDTKTFADSIESLISKQLLNEIFTTRLP